MVSALWKKRSPKGARRICKSYLLACLVALVACTSSPQVPKGALKLTPESLEKRQRQTRFFATDNESLVLDASTNVLQDLGFHIDESEKQLGLIVGSKQRSAKDPAEITVAVILFILAAGSGSSHADQMLVWGEVQKMRVCIVARRTNLAGGGTSVRVTFQREIFSNKGGVWRREELDSPEIFQEFFAKLSKALFLEAQQI